MGWIDLHTDYLSGTFREMERAKQQMEAEGREVVCACHCFKVQEQAAQWWVLASFDSPGRFLDYTFGSPRRSCGTARDSLDTAKKLLHAQHTAEYKCFVIARL